MKRVSILFSIIALIFILPVVCYADDWRRLQSENFTVVGDASEGDMKKLTERLEEFRNAIARLFPTTKVTAERPTIVYFFANPDSFEPFQPMSNGKVRKRVGGYFIRRAEMNYIAMADFPQLPDSERIILHEYFHNIVRHNLRVAPLWLNEGMAEFYSTFYVDAKSKRITLGRLIDRHITTLKSGRSIPLEKLFQIGHSSREYNGGDTHLFYSKSWILIHYLIVGKDGQRNDQFIKFIDLINANTGKTMAECFNQAFHTDYQGMEKELRDYINKFSYPIQHLKLNQSIDFTEKLAAIKISQSEAHYLKGELLLNSGRFDESVSYYEKSLKSNNGYLPAQLGLGLARLKQGDYPAAEKLLKPALRTDEKNYRSHYYHALLLKKQQHYPEAIAAFHTATQLNPRNSDIFSELGYSCILAGDPAAAEQAFQQAIQLDPDDVQYYRTRAQRYLAIAEGRRAAEDAIFYLQKQGWDDEHAPYLAVIAYLGFRQAKDEQYRDQADQMLAQAMQTSRTDWPYPIVQYLQQKLPLNKLMELVGKDVDRLTEAHAYVGIDLLISGRRDQALPHLQWVKENGTKTFTEYILVKTILEDEAGRWKKE